MEEPGLGAGKTFILCAGKGKLAFPLGAKHRLEVDKNMLSGGEWTRLYKIGGSAALVAALLFRRNIGAEVSLFTGVDSIPHSVAGWYSLLQANPWVGLSFLGVFDLANYALEGLVFLALAVACWQAYRSTVSVALAVGGMGIAISFAANISLTMFSFSQQYAGASSEGQRASLLAAGQAVLAAKDPLAVFPGTGAYTSVLLIALAGLSFSIALWPSQRLAAITGLLASGCDLAYCLTLPFAPSLRTLWMASGGLFWMVWHLLIAVRLLKYARGK